MTIKCASEKWKEIFILNDLSFEKIPESCKSKRDIPIVIAKNVLKYPEQVREFLENGYWWMNRCITAILGQENLLILDLMLKHISIH